MLSAVKKRNVNLAPTKAVVNSFKRMFNKKYNMEFITDNKIITKIEDALEEIRPFLKEDGGDIDFVELTDDWIVKVNCWSL